MRTPEADKRTPDAPPRAEARPSPTAAPAAVTRALSALAQPGRAERLVGAEAARAAKKLGAHLLPSLRLPAIPLPHAIAPPAVAGGRLANTRRLLQIGLALGIAYLVFLSFWFWGTRGRHRGLRRGVRF
jgi:hypothetical protein